MAYENAKEFIIDDYIDNKLSKNLEAKAKSALNNLMDMSL